jgi:adenosylhomocysteine nucleosidase
MWILHTSDLHIASDNTHTDGVLESLGKWVLECTDGKKLDFLIVSGNLTKDGSPDSFELAHRQLARFNQENILGPASKETGLPRIVVAPGPLDCVHGGGVSFENYEQFLRRLYATRSGERVSKNGVMLRQLKAITLISVPFWSDPAPGQQAGLQSLYDGMKELRLPDFEYARSTPTLLISSGFPAHLSGHDDTRRLLERLHESCQQHLEIELHLFGHGPATALLPETAALGHVALSTGLKHSSSAWPFRANLLNINFRRVPAEYPREDAFMTNRVYLQHAPDAPSSSRPHISGHLDLYFHRKLESDSECNFAAFLGELVETPQRVLVVYGLAGAGKREFERQAMLSASWGKRPVFVISKELSTYSKKSILAGFVRAVEAELNSARHSANQTAIVLIREVGAAREASEKREEFLDSDAIQELIYSRGVRIVVLSRLPIIGSDFVDSLRLPPLTDDEVARMVCQCGVDLPCDAEALGGLTGRFAGFSRVLLGEMVKSFHGMSPVAAIDASTSGRLMKDAVGGHAFINQARASIRSIETLSGGHEICEYISKKAAAHRKSGSALPLFLSASDVERENPSRPRAEYDFVFEYLTMLGVIEQVEGLGEFRLLVQAPFLAETVPRSEPPVTAPRASRPTARSVLRGFPAEPDILVLTALPEERDAVLALLDTRDTAKRNPGEIYKFHRAWLDFEGNGSDSKRYSIVVSETGKGRVPAAIATTMALERWRPSYVVLVGIAGGVKGAKVAVGDLLIASSIQDGSMTKVYSDHTDIRWDPHRVDPALLAMSRSIGRTSERLSALARSRELPAVHWGTVVTGDASLSAGEVDEQIRATFPDLIGREMEAGGVATAVWSQPYPPRFFMIRGCSDLADGDRASLEVKAMRRYVCDVTAAYAVGLLESGPIVPRPRA